MNQSSIKRPIKINTGNFHKFWLKDVWVFYELRKKWVDFTLYGYNGHSVRVGVACHPYPEAYATNPTEWFDQQAGK